MTFANFLGFLWDYRWPLVNGLGTTLLFTALSLSLGLALGFLTSVARHYGPRWLATLAAGYVELFRGTPVLIQLFWFFFCLPALLNVEIGTWITTVIALSLYMGALSSESFRSALKNIGAEQQDACIALGLSPRTRLQHVILPQAVIRAIPNLLSNGVTLFKESALISAVGMADLMYQAQSIADSTARPIGILTFVALVYFVIAFTMTRVVGLYERRMLTRMAT